MEAQEQTQPEHRKDDDDEAGMPGPTPVPKCPEDPDCFAYDACNVECPDYWTCETHPSGEGKRCTNPGPDYPDNSQQWDCEDTGGQTVCRAPDYPDGGGGSQWNCEERAEFVECTKDEPSYPDGHGDGPWNCYYQNEFRICENAPDEEGETGGGGWVCYDAPTGRECRKMNPSYPDDREWDCYETEDQVVCTGRGDLPDGGGSSEWDCESRAELVMCTNDDPDYPDGGGDQPWQCEYRDEFRICRSNPPEEDNPDDGDYSCPPGQQRWCDDAVYCSWGKQTCQENGEWGPCVEPELTQDGLSDRPNTECGCRYFYFNRDCCEDQQDRNGDGKADCFIPDDHTTPDCDRSGELCSGCDTSAQCNDGQCLFTRSGLAFCGTSCSSDGDCPDGYSCREVRTRQGESTQCVPDDGQCL
jgi:hypothetical protein